MTSQEIIKTPLEYLKGVGPDRALLLAKELRLFNFEDLLFHFPLRYVDKSNVVPINLVNSDLTYFQCKGKISNTSLILGKGQRFTAILTDATGSIELIWFKGIKWATEFVKDGGEYVVFGKPNYFNNKLNFTHPEIEKPKLTPDLTQGGLQPVYSTTEKLKTRFLDSRGIRKLVLSVFEKVRGCEEILPENLLKKYRLPNRWEAIKNLHFPDNDAKLKRSIARMKFEELFVIQLQLVQHKKLRDLKSKGVVFSNIGELFNSFYNDSLPFQLTNAQKRVFKEIREDTRTGHQMNRLLQGDVGSGKTIIALLSMLLALDNGFQSCLMAPTEILARQHYDSISTLLKKAPIKIELLTGTTSVSDRKKMSKLLEDGDLHIIIGTHALLEDWIKFPNLGLVIIDEQHRFGVAQRAKMWEKSVNLPHVLVMTATPIPRTLAMTLYGDLDVSTIDELPPGRKPILTYHLKENNRLRVIGLMKSEIAAGRQVYVVYPLIEGSEKLDYQDLMNGYDLMEREFPIPKYQISIVHGKMKPADKQIEMKRFKDGITNLLVSTTVIEVGVDVPNASLMIIESAEKFGLSQLHQLRGRVGRGSEKSYCILMTKNELTTDARERMQTMVRTNNGFEIAEADLKIRGPGDLAGTQQSGVLNLKIANLTTDQNILIEARNAAISLIAQDPDILLPENKSLSIHLMKSELEREREKWSRVS